MLYCLVGFRAVGVTKALTLRLSRGIAVKIRESRLTVPFEDMALLSCPFDPFPRETICLTAIDC